MKTPKREVVTNKVVSERLRWSVESNLCLLSSVVLRTFFSSWSLHKFGSSFDLVTALSVLWYTSK